MPTVLSIVMPAYNESKRIGETLEIVTAFIGNQPYECEIIVVDDGSTDKTSSVVKEFLKEGRSLYLIRHDKNKGKGAAVNTGFKAAKGQFILFSDADLSTPIEEVNRMLDYIKQHDQDKPPCGIVIASRRVKGARLVIPQPMYREFSGRVFSVIVQVINFGGYLDTQCGFKLFAQEVGKKIVSKQTIMGFGFDVEMLFIALKKLKVGVKEMPVTWIDSPQSRVNLFKDSIDMFLDLLRIRWNDLLGRYTYK